MEEDLLVCNNVLVFKSLYGRIRITKSSQLAAQLQSRTNGLPLAGDNDYIYLNNENDFMGNRASAIVNMCIYIRKSDNLLYVSVVDLRPADPYKQSPTSTADTNDCDSGFRSLHGSGSVCHQGDMHHQPFSPVPTTSSLPTLPTASAMPAKKKRQKKSSLPEQTSSRAPLQQSI